MTDMQKKKKKRKRKKKKKRSKVRHVSRCQRQPYRQRQSPGTRCHPPGPAAHAAGPPSSAVGARTSCGPAHAGATTPATLYECNQPRKKMMKNRVSGGNGRDAGRTLRSRPPPTPEACARRPPARRTRPLPTGSGFGAVSPEDSFISSRGRNQHAKRGRGGLCGRRRAVRGVVRGAGGPERARKARHGPGAARGHWRHLVPVTGTPQIVENRTVGQPPRLYQPRRLSIICSPSFFKFLALFLDRYYIMSHPALSSISDH